MIFIASNCIFACPNFWHTPAGPCIQKFDAAQCSVWAVNHLVVQEGPPTGRPWVFELLTAHVTELHVTSNFWMVLLMHVHVQYVLGTCLTHVQLQRMYCHMPDTCSCTMPYQVFTTPVLPCQQECASTNHVFNYTQVISDLLPQCSTTLLWWAWLFTSSTWTQRKFAPCINAVNSLKSGPLKWGPPEMWPP